MIEIVAAVVSVSLAAIIGVKIAGYRNLITYEITTISQSLAVHENQIVPSESAATARATRIYATRKTLVN